MKLLLDTNVVVDLLLERTPWVDEAKAIAAHVLSSDVEGFVAAAAVGTVHYVIEKQSDKVKARSAIDRMIGAFDIAELNFEIVWQAMLLHGPDFEDDLQIASAVACGADLIVTRNLSDFAHSPVPAVSPAEALSRIRAAVQ